MSDPFLNPNTARNQNQQDQNAISLEELTKSAAASNARRNSQEVAKAKVRKGSSVSLKGFMIGCGIFIFIFFILMFLGLSYLISNPSNLKSLGIDQDNAKSFLMVIAVLFFGILFLTGITALFINGFRVATVKESKGKYILGAVFGFLLVSFSIGGGTYSVFTIKGMSSKSEVSTNNLIDPYILTAKDPLLDSDSIPKIAPANVIFRLNKELLYGQVLKQLQLNPQDLRRFELDCGNGQAPLKAGPDILSKGYFAQNCLFLKKGDYPLKLKIYYNDATKGSENFAEDVVKTLSFTSEIKMEINGKPLGDGNINDNKDELQGGTVPTKVSFDATKVFQDYGIPDYNIEWYIDGAKKNIPTSDVKMINTFSNAKLYKISYLLPSIGQVPFLIQLRVSPSSIPECDLTSELQKNDVDGANVYRFTVPEDVYSNVDESSVRYSVVDLSSSKEIDSLDKTSRKVKYKFPEGGRYKMYFNFTTRDGENGSCASKDISSVTDPVNIICSVRGKSPSEKKYSQLDFGCNSSSGDVITISRVPYTVQFHIDKIVPDDNGSVIRLLFNKKEIPAVDTNTYEININDEKENDNKLTVEVTNKNGDVTTNDYKLDIQKKPIIAHLNLTPEKGAEPLTVQLDASLSELLGEGDEIVFFSWDFGDGKKLKNTSQGVVTHDYSYDKESDNGIFQPKVTVTTKNGYQDTAIGKVMVTKEVKKAKITIDPPFSSQTVRIGDVVKFNVEADGDISNIKWDFGNGKSISGEGREYMSTSSVYDEKGTYKVKVTVEFKDYPAVYETITVKAIE